jgi:aldehyde dehydrogenase (NAD+)/phenylacetaldehyde dehydrogenase
MALSIPADVTLQESTLSFLNTGPRQLFINNQWISAQSGETFASINPANGEELVQVALAGPEDVDLAVQAAREAFERGPWGTMNAEERAGLLWKLADLVDQHADQLAELETLDNGKPIRVSRKGDLPAVSRHFRYYAGWATKLEGATLPVSFPNQFVYTLREPVGVVGLIIPWNFPADVPRKLAPPSLRNTRLLKPAEDPATALRLGELIPSAGFRGVVTIPTGPGEPTGQPSPPIPAWTRPLTGSGGVGARSWQLCQAT